MDIRSKHHDSGEEALRSLALALGHATVYGPTHRMTAAAIEQAHRQLATALGTQPSMTIGLLDDNLLINDHRIDPRGPIQRSLIPAMRSLNLDTFSIDHSLSLESLTRLLQILAKGSQYQPGEVSRATFQRALQVSDVRGVNVHHITYQKVRDDQQVIAKTEATATSDATQQLVAATGVLSEFLQALGVGDRKRAATAVTKLMDDPEDLARALMHAVRKFQQTGDEDATGTLAERLAGAMEGALQNLPNTPTAFRAAIRQIEQAKQLFDGGTQQFPWLGEQSKVAIESVLDEATQALNVEILAEEYRKRKEALKKSEKQIARFIRAKGPETVEQSDLPDRLTRSGMSFGQWCDILAVANRRTSKHRRGAIDRLGTLARQIGETADRDATAPMIEALIGQLPAAVKEIDTASNKLMERIGEWVAAMHEEEAAALSSAPDQRRRKRLELLAKLAEIAQELCQPLTVISASIDMVAGNYLGEVNEAQIGMLKLAAEGAERMRKLAYKLMEIANVPKALQPDQEILANLYQ